MAAFEFVQVIIAIVLGLGLTDVLRNLGEQIRRRDEIEICSLQVMASCLLLVVLLFYLWSLWSASDVAWTLPLFVLKVLPAVALALAAQVIKVDCDSTKAIEDQYFENCTATFSIWAMAPLFDTVFMLASGVDFATEFAVIRIGIVALLLSLGFVKRPNYHKVVFGVLLVSVVVGTPLTQFEL